VLSRLTLPGSLYLAAVAVLPSLFIRYGGFSQANARALGGTSVLIVVGGAVALWLRHGDPLPLIGPTAEPALLTKPVWSDNPEIQAREQVAAAGPSGEAQTIGGRPPGDYDFRDDQKLNSTLMGVTDLFPANDADFRACEKLSGEDGIAACDRAIASGKFSWRGLSYLYSDRGFLLMQKGALDAALSDFNEAATLDSSNFYASWNRGAVYAAKGDFDHALSDFNRSLALNPDKTSKAKIEEALSAVTAASKAANAQTSEPGVITDPSAFWGHDSEGSASAASSFPTDAMPSAPALTPTLPASPMPAQVR